MVKLGRLLSLFGILLLMILTNALAAAGTGNGSLHGIVIVPSGYPIPGATVSVEGKAGAHATTDINGEFNLSGLDAGSYTVHVTASGFDPFQAHVTVTANLVTEVDAVLMATPKPAAAPESPATVPATATTPGAGEKQVPPPAAQTIATQNLSVIASPGKAAIYGNVTDQSGAVVPNGTVTASGSAGSLSATVNLRGQYVLNGLLPGLYALRISVAGFAAFETVVTVTANQALQIDATLQPASEKTEVNVAAQNTQVETQSAHIEGTVTEREVLETGLNGRNFTQLIALAPGVSNQTGQDEAKVGVAGSVKYSVNGGRVEYNNFDVDGSDVLNAGLNGAESTLMVYPSLDAIQEVKVLTSNYGAQYGRTASGTVLVTTKSGTPNFHGGAYGFLRNEFFNARNYFDPPGKAPLYRRQDFGFTLGGPVIPKGKKDFFFWSEEFRLENSPIGPSGEDGDFNQAVPTLAERAGNFNDVCPYVLPGQTTTFLRESYPDCPGAASAGKPGEYLTYAGNELGAQSGTTPNLNSNSTILMNALIPLPNSATGCNSSLAGQTDAISGLPYMPCYVAAVSPHTYWREELGRFDHDFTPSMRASFRYIHDSWNTTTTIPQWGYLQTAGIHEQSFPTVENQLNGPGISMVARLANTLSPSLLNEFVVSYVDSKITLNDISGPGGNLGATVPRTGSNSIGAIFNNGFGGKLPGIVISGTNAAYGGNGFAVDTSYMPWEHTNPTYGLTDNLSKVIGTHTLQIGIQAVNARRAETNGAIGAATGDIQGLLTFSNFSQTGSGNAFADFLGTLISSAGPNVASFQQDSAQLKYYNNYWIAEPYVQDDWRLNHRLTINLGVRFSVFGNYHELNLNAYNWEQSAFNTTLASTVSIQPVNQQGFGGGNLLVNGQPVTLPLGPNSVVTNGLMQCGKNGIPASCMSSHLFNPAPRIGFAWDPEGDGKTSIRGGYGLFYEHGTAKEANTGSLEGSAPLVLTMTQPEPAQGYTGIGGGAAFPIDVTSIPTKTLWSYAQQWSFSVQRQLPRDTVATLAYVGSKGTHLSAELQLNQLTPPPTGPDLGIFPNGNPFQPGQPITSQICQSYTGTVNPDDTSYSRGNFTVGNIVVVPDEPAWPNLAAACYAENPGKIPIPSSLRTFAPGMGRVLSLQNIADSQYHALQATLRRTSGPLTVGASYTYSHSLDDSSDRSDTSFVNSANLKSSWASSNFDQRHLLAVNYIYAFPHVSGLLEGAGSSASDPSSSDNPPSRSNSQFLHLVFDDWELSGITVFQSGTPFSVINGGSPTISVPDNAGVANGSGSGSYPDVIGNPRANVPQGTIEGTVGPQLYNPAAFVAPQGLTFGNAGRNFLNNPHRLNFDTSLLKHFKVSEGSALEFRVEAFNIFNHTEFRIFNSNIGNTASNAINCYGGENYSAAGGLTPIPGAPLGTPPVEINCTVGNGLFHPVDAHRPRTLQMGLKYSF